VHGGEIVGIAGISGNGQKELLDSLSGERPLERDRSRRICIDGREVGSSSVAARRDLGMTFIPEDRLGRAVVASMTLADNCLLTAHRTGMVRFGIIDSNSVNTFAERCVHDFDVRCRGVETHARTLSGGNLQKFIVARELLQKPGILIVSQPTWGVDVGAAAAIRRALVDLRNDGVAILLVSEELEELFEISDRIFVIAGGRLSPGKRTSDTDMEEIGLWMSGLFSAAEGDGNRV
jgi:ABC-type uncharacterized transport system ATPase subunit